jgi:hypothetical protein
MRIKDFFADERRHSIGQEDEAKAHEQRDALYSKDGWEGGAWEANDCCKDHYDGLMVVRKGAIDAIRECHITFQLSVGPMHLVVHELINYATCSSQNKQGCGSKYAIISVRIQIRIRIKKEFRSLRGSKWRRGPSKWRR